MGYSFTSPEVAGALVRAKQRGLDVKVVLDWKANTGRQNKASLAAMNLLVNAGIPVRTVSQYKIMHDKVIIADGRNVEVGSFNYTRAADRVELADVRETDRILEPSAGTGAILQAIRDAVPRAKCDAVELHAGLARHLQAHFPEVRIWCGDFLEYHPERRYTRIIMNPPFNRGDDIRHIRRALTLLEPGGILTGICLDGPRQQKALESLADVWEPLPRGTFTYTQVATAILRITV
ncbi:phospholipase D-like domain-containing protein [Klebsiella pneumoniae]|nr:phospholipase D-like domain-containing protein [Klebsiella pneumoniae]